MNWHERAMRRAMFLAGAPESDVEEWRKGRHALAAWIRERCETMPDDELPRGKRPTLANIRDIQRLTQSVDTFAGWVSQARASFRAQIDGADAGA